MKLVGVWVHSPEKVGKDAGELAGGEPIGVTATNDAVALIALHPIAWSMPQVVPNVMPPRCVTIGDC
jgi:hypothetical protein